jgi:hypothetical protein
MEQLNLTFEALASIISWGKKQTQNRIALPIYFNLVNQPYH